ncbi:MAG: hypothetical protein KAW46_04425 [candidate division Zixibacteria bacterium]|nr:hypothetical protein [candidate division Zixibacteria bacterium]
MVGSLCPGRNVILSIPPNVILSIPPNVILSGVEGWRKVRAKREEGACHCRNLPAVVLRTRGF